MTSSSPQFAFDVYAMLNVCSAYHIQGGGEGRGRSWRSGESTPLPPMCPGLDFQTLPHMRVEFVTSPFSLNSFLPHYIHYNKRSLQNK